MSACKQGGWRTEISVAQSSSKKPSDQEGIFSHTSTEGTDRQETSSKEQLLPTGSGGSSPLNIILLSFAGFPASYAAITPGQNTYLPPKQNGYNYNKPSIPFQPQHPSPQPFRPSPSSSAPRPTQFQPPTPPRPTYGAPSSPAPQPRPIYGAPSSQQPQQPTFGLPSPQSPTPFKPQSAPYPKPTYGATQGPPSTGPNYVGQPSSPSGQHAAHEDQHHHEPGMPFDFNYAVKDDQYGNDYSHNAVSNGDVTTGEYRIQLPDGRTQIVKYTADWKSGFHAQVRFEGMPTYPQYQGRPSNQAPTYQSGPTAGPPQGYPSLPAGPKQPTQGYPTGPSRPSQPTQGYPSGPAPGHSSGPKATPGFPTHPTRPNQIPGQQYTPDGGYKY